MNRNILRGLIILVAVIIVALLVWRFYQPAAPTVGTGPAATAKPPVAPPPGPITTAPVKPQAIPGVSPFKEGTPPESSITLPAPQAMGNKYGILVGTYPKYPQAARMLAVLKKRGQPSFAQRDPRDSSRFQVWLGPFSSQDEARASQKAMRGRIKKPLKIEQIENPVPK